MTDILFWVLFGILAGWIMVILNDSHGRQRVLGTMVVGILGALAGGALMRMLNERGIAGLSIPSLLAAVCGALILLAITTKTAEGRENERNREK
jgi:uncharacterized membrane protein YeaQ/YmgE (transglycosylase-associated protein family)